MEQTFTRKTAFVRMGRDGITTVMVMLSDDKGYGWEVYYTREGYPYMFVFGLPLVHHLEEVFIIADDNIHAYENLFK